jgi:methyl halide transferase
VDRQFWQGVYHSGAARFDLEGPTPALCDWLDGHLLSPGRALVPGCGRGHDVIELARRGFSALGVDYARTALRDARALAARSRLPARFEERDLLDLLPDPARPEPWPAQPSLPEGSIDLWWENSCYCTADPARRDEYARIAARLVCRGGMLLFLAFPRRAVRAAEIAPRFAPHFVLRALAPPPRPSSPGHPGRELLAVLERV